MTKPQFSLRMMFAAMAVIAICAGFWRAQASWQCGLAFLPFSILVPASTALLAVRATSIAKSSFWAVAVVMLMGALFEVGKLYSAGQMLYDEIRLRELLESIAYQKRAVIVVWAAAPLAGVLSAIAHIVVGPRKPAE